MDLDFDDTSYPMDDDEDVDEAYNNGVIDFGIYNTGDNDYSCGCDYSDKGDNCGCDYSCGCDYFDESDYCGCDFGCPQYTK